MCTTAFGMGVQKKHPYFGVGKTLKGIIADWSDTQLQGLQEAVKSAKLRTKLAVLIITHRSSCNYVAFILYDPVPVLYTSYLRVRKTIATCAN